MNHTDVEEQNLVDRYVMGKLSAAETERFEDHYLSCPECLDRLDLAESMQRGFKRAAGQDAARLATSRQLALVAWLSRLGRSRQVAALVMALLVVAILPAGLALRQIGERDRELERTRSALRQERQRAAA
ncbi:MAG TPA: zf-HC2 domain-containing protein, partial [Thermoanaerobaculia bacterium]